MDTKPTRVVVAGDTCVSAQGLATIVGRDKRYQARGGAHGFYDAGELIRKHRPDVLLIEPFLEDRDGIWWIKGGIGIGNASVQPVAVSNKWPPDGQRRQYA